LRVVVIDFILPLFGTRFRGEALFHLDPPVVRGFCLPASGGVFITFASADVFVGRPVASYTGWPHPPRRWFKLSPAPLNARRGLRVALA